MNYLIDKTKWSKSSQNSSLSNYLEKATEYEGISYSCVKCGVSLSFTPKEQKEKYEVEKKYIDWLPRRCPQCQKQLDALKNKNNEFQNIWNSNKETIINDTKIIKEWLMVLREMLKYKAKTNEAMIICLVKELNK